MFNARKLHPKDTVSLWIVQLSADSKSETLTLLIQTNSIDKAETSLSMSQLIESVSWNCVGQTPFPQR